MKLHKAGLTVLLLVLVLGWVKAVWAQDEDLDSDIPGAKPTDYIRERTYIGILGTSADIDQYGDFNGTNLMTFNNEGTTVNNGVTYTLNEEQDLIPSITRQFGWGVLFGHREGPWAAELSFWSSNHTATWIGSNGAGGATTITNPASLQAINIDFKRYFFTAFPTQPFVSFGISFPWLYVENGSYLLNSTTGTYTTNNETISGIGFDLGAGMELYLDNNFSLLGGLYERWTDFDQINGASKIPLNQMYFDGNPSDVGNLEGNGLNIYIGTTFGVE